MYNKIFASLKYEQRMFLMFLVIYLLVWSLIGLFRTIMPTDTLEGIYWGSLHDFGTPKHPPLAGWISYISYSLFHKDIFMYFVSQSCILIGAVYIFRLAKCFLQEKQAMLSVLILIEGCWCYSYITGYYGLNPDVLLLMMLPIITFYFYNCMYKNNPSDWVKLGIIVGLSFLNKYQTAFLIIAMAIWAIKFKKDVFKNKFFYLSIVLAFLIFLPHLCWLFKYDFFPLSSVEHELTATSWYNHITAPLIFFIVQIGVIAGTLAIFFITKYRFNSPIQIDKNREKKDIWFLLLFGFGPIAIHLIMGFLDGGTMRPRWGFEFWYMTGIMLFYFFPINIEKTEFKFILKLCYSVMLIIFLALGTLLSVEKNYRSKYPVEKVFNDIQEIWSKNVDTPLKYVGGYIEWTLPLVIYGKSHPDCILDTYGYENPWIKEKDLKKSGIFMIDRTILEVVKHTRETCPYLGEDYKIKPTEYKFTLENTFKQKREYSVYYYIVPPME